LSHDADLNLSLERKLNLDAFAVDKSVSLFRRHVQV